jgi:hypothetical protein
MTAVVAAVHFVSGLLVYESSEFRQQLDPGLFQSL